MRIWREEALNVRGSERNSVVLVRAKNASDNGPAARADGKWMTRGWRKFVDKSQQFHADATTRPRIMAAPCRRPHTMQIYLPTIYCLVISGDRTGPSGDRRGGRPDESWPLAATRGGNVDRETPGECRIH